MKRRAEGANLRACIYVPGAEGTMCQEPRGASVPSRVGAERNHQGKRMNPADVVAVSVHLGHESNVIGNASRRRNGLVSGYIGAIELGATIIDRAPIE